MDASSITKRKQTGTLYTAYINQVVPPVSAASPTLFSNPNTAPQVFEYVQDSTTGKYTNIIKYGANNFMTFGLQNDVREGSKVCGNNTIISTFNTQEDAASVAPYVCPEQYVTLTTLPVVCPNTEFYQGTNFINLDGS